MRVDLRVKHDIGARKAAIELFERGHGWICYSQSTQEGPRMEGHQGVSRGEGPCGIASGHGPEKSPRSHSTHFDSMKSGNRTEF